MSLAWQSADIPLLTERLSLSGHLAGSLRTAPVSRCGNGDYENPTMTSAQMAKDM